MNNITTNETFTPGLHNLKHVIINLPPTVAKSGDYVKWTPKIDSLGYFFSARESAKNNSLEHFNACKVERNDKLIKPETFFRNLDLEISGIIWRDGWYRNENFDKCYLLSFDIDNGTPTLNEALSALMIAKGMLWTSKSHQKPKCEHAPCDRYHAFLNLDRPITSLREYKLAVAAFMMVLCPTVDEAMPNGTFKMRGGPADAIVQPLGGNDYNVICVDKLIKFAEDNIPEFVTAKNEIYDNYTENGKRNVLQIFSGSIGEHKPDGNLKRVLKKFYAEKCTLEDTYRNIFKLMLYAFSVTLNSQKVKATILDMEELKPFYTRHRGQLTGIDEALNKAKNSYLTNSIEKLGVGLKSSLQPLNELVTLKSDELQPIPEFVRAYLNKHIDINGINWDSNMEATLRLIHGTIHGDNRKAIVAVPPGLAKSTSATAIVAAYAATDRRYLIVKPSVAACRQQLTDLIALGANKNDLSLLVGYDDKHEICDKPFRHGKNGPYHQCKDCDKNKDRDENGKYIPLIERCLIGQTYTNRAEQMMKNIIIMTHQRFSTLWTTNSIPPDVTIIIDEAMQSYDIMSLDKAKLNALGKLVQSVCDHKKYLDSNIRDNCIRDEFCFTRKDGNFINEDEKEKLIEIVKSGDYGKCDNPPDDVQDSIDMAKIAKAYLSAYYDKNENEQSSRYVFDNSSDIVKNEDNEKQNVVKIETYDVIKSRIYCDLPNRIIILDGSAIFSNTCWDGFTIYQIDIHKQILFDNVTLHAFNGNPTKNSVKAKFPQYADMIESFLDKNLKNETAELCIISNKQKEDALEQTKRFKNFISFCEDRKMKTINLYRGTVIGSNQARNSRLIAVLASMFNGVSETVLRTALRLNCGIEAEQIWNYQRIDGKNGVNVTRKVVRMNNGFEDESLNETFLRTYADEIIQYILRGRARNYTGETEDVFYFSIGEMINEEIRAYLPGVQFAGDSGMKKLREMTKEQIEGVSARELAEMFGYSSKNDATSNELIRYRDMIYLEKINA